MWLKRQLETCEGNEKRYIRTRRIDVIFSAGFSSLMVPFHFSSCVLRRMSMRASERASE